MAEETGFFVGERSQQIFYRLWQPSVDARALIVLAHGAAEHSGRYHYLAEYFLNQGYAVAALDHSGHGHSDGRPGHIDHFADHVSNLSHFTALLKDIVPPMPWILLGHSMGGLIAARLLLDGPENFQACVLSAPAIMTDLTPPFWQQVLIRLVSRLLPRLGVLQLDAAGVSRDPEVVAAYRGDPMVYTGKLSARMVEGMFDTMLEVQSRASELSIPLLILHGDADALTSVDGSVFLLEHAGSSDKTLQRYAELFHEIFNEPEKDRVLADVSSWLTERLTERLSR